MSARLPLGLALVCALAPACKPAAVKAVDEWLLGYAAGDVERVVANTYSGDRELVRAALVEMQTVPTGTLAISLPPRPLSHELIEVESKDDSGKRWVIATKTKLKNPLPYMSKRVGHLLEEMPKTREQRRKFLAVLEEGERWGVKLDLARVLERHEFAAAFLRRIDAKQLDEAELMLEKVPPPPDEANALSKSDRLRDSLRAELDKARKTAAAASPP